MKLKLAGHIKAVTQQLRYGLQKNSRRVDWFLCNLNVLCAAFGFEVGSRSAFLVDHELLEGVQVRRDERADRLVVVVEDLLPMALGASRAGGADQAGEGRAVTLEETRRPLSQCLDCNVFQIVSRVFRNERR